AIDMLAPILERKDVASLKLTLLEIATTVAEAYREDDEAAPDLMGQLAAQVHEFIGRFMSQLNRRPASTADVFANISGAERAALAELTTALQPETVEGLPPADADAA
ncbi:MAG: hypothetical protein KJ667_07660, partial [Alphaproteobacteria bacterium]|nr:hypothetical protein [Alphaproteobacteria bacterium]